ncbi:MAG: NAD-dependent epimerase/dehydratase family protein [Alphaproteobacteria bacterium]|nr:NAD-dependent epimerase/dehydratase family protein [Alphaproteobacteria bacterium]
MKTILMTGAAGGIGTFLREELGTKYKLRLSDRAPVQNLRGDETYIGADLTNLNAVKRAAEGVDGILHFGGCAGEADWQTILDANIVGMRNVYEAALQSGVKRVVWASSNHAVGFYRRDQTIDHTVYPKPDSRYGVSKVFGEAMGSLYADKYGLEVVNLRIGNVATQPVDKRRLSIWVSPRDLAQLCAISLDHPDIKFEIFYGASDNARGWWDNSNAERFGYKPQDQSEPYADAVIAKEPPASPDDTDEIYQGGAFVSTEQGGGRPRSETV